MTEIERFYKDEVGHKEDKISRTTNQQVEHPDNDLPIGYENDDERFKSNIRQRKYTSAVATNIREHSTSDSSKEADSQNSAIDTQNAKADAGKLQISLVPMQIVRDIAKVRMYGNEKYHSPANWVLVEKQRYIDALLRHLLEYIDNNNAIDKESGLSTLSHIACNVAFLCEMERPDWEERKKTILRQFNYYYTEED